jgi:hypothetical protein
MITFRHHLLSLVAVFLALAIGIALGGGPLSEVGRPDDNAASASPVDEATRRTADYGNAFAATSANRLYAAGLSGHPVAVLAMPGAADQTISAITAQIGVAGGGVAGIFNAQPALLDPSQKSLIDDFGSQLVTQLADPRLDAAASTYVRVGQLIALAIATEGDKSAKADEVATSIRDSLAAASLLTSAENARLSPLVLVVLPPGKEGNPDDAPTRAVLSGLVTGLADHSVGVVAVGDTDSAESGELAAVRSVKVPGPIITVDGVESALGQVTTVLGLIRILTEGGGAFGASGEDGAIPLQ